MADGRTARGHRRRRRFDSIELVLVAAFIGVAVWIAKPSPTLPEQVKVRALERQFGPARYSQNYEEWIAREFFRDQRNGFFLDVGANHYRTNSTTYFLEAALGWSGIAVEPLEYFEADYRRYRPRTRFRAFFVSDVSNEKARLYTLADGRDLVTSGNKAFTERYGPETRELTAPTITLNDLLDTEGVKRVDFLSMDIELYEPKALAGFDLHRFQPRLVCIEAHPEVRQQIIDYFVERRYTIVSDYLRIDVHNLYFMPLN